MTKATLPFTTISLIIPSYNDETTVGRLIEDSTRLLEEICPDYELIVTNDGSSDNTLKVLQDCANKNSHIKVINHKINQGYGNTIKELYLSGSKEVIFSLPGDYQYAPQELIKMAPSLANYDFVIGLRVKRNDPWRRKLQSNIYNLMLRVIYGNRHKDVNSIKLFKRAILGKITLKADTAFVDAELCLRAEKAGFKLIEIPIEHLPRLSQGASGGKLSVIFATFSDLVKMRGAI